MSRRRFLTQQFHDAPPKFNAAQRQRHLYLDTAFIDEILPNVRGSENKVYIALAYCYFKVSFQFFDTAYTKDLNYITRKLSVPHHNLNWERYQRDTQQNHKKLILNFMGCCRFEDAKAQTSTINFIERHARTRTPFKECFCQLATKLHKERIEIPAYTKLKKMITAVYAEHESRLLKIVDAELSKHDKERLDRLFGKKQLNDNSRSSQYQLTLLKRFSHSLAPTKIANNIEAFETLSELFWIAQPIVEKLEMSNEAIRHYATSVHKNQVFQIKRRADESRYLHLITFIVHQFYQLQDVLIETLMSAVTSSYNTAEREAKEYYYKMRNEQTKNTRRLVGCSTDMLQTLDNIKTILADPSLDDSVKVEKALHLLSPKKHPSESLADAIDDVNNDLDRMSGEALFYHFLEAGSLKLQRRCNDIVKCLIFSQQSTNKSLLLTIDKFKEKKGKVDDSYSVRFLTTTERKHIDTKEKFKASLYKVVLFNHIKQAIKGDSLCLQYSYHYKALDEYLIPLNRWEKNKDKLLRQANMQQYADFKQVMAKLEQELHTQYQETNEHILAKLNTDVKTHELGGYRLVSQKNTAHEQILLDDIDIELYPTENFVPISEVLSTVHKATGFLDEFQPHHQKYLKDRPEDRTLIAAIIGTGCHFSTPQFAKHSRSLNNNALITTANNYISSENARQACNSILQFVEKMPLANLFIDEHGLQTSSDGQKWTVSTDSLNANYSFKYGGKDPVISEYKFIDCRNLFYHDKVISGAEREAHYMIDGVLDNEVIKSDLHSTDTHGYTEMVFGAAHLLDISFAPRIKNVHKLYLYSLKNKQAYTQRDYPVLPKKKINLRRIEKYWDDILRLVVSIKLGETTASQIFKRLNSYSQDDNPLYIALKEFGRIIKSLYILRYIDDPELRGAVHKQLNKGESGNKLDRALAIGRPDYAHSTKEEQETLASCKRVIKNAIICWNYMFLTQKLMNTTTKIEKQTLIDKIKTSSTISWEHILFHGAYDFSDSTLQDSRFFIFKKMHDQNVLTI